MHIEVVDEGAQAEPAHLAAVLSRIAHHQHVKHVTIYVSPREESGWLEYIAVLNYTNGGQLTMGCLQREPGAPVEFHT